MRRPVPYNRTMRDGQQQREEVQRGAGAGPDAAPVQDPTPGLNAVRRITDTSERGAASVVRILRAHPMERDEILAWLHQNRGSAFVRLVTAQLGQIERELPEGVELKSVRGSVTIPAKRRLMGDWKATIETEHATQLGAEVNERGISVWLNPSLLVNATWPMRDCEIRRAGVHFTEGKPYADVADGGGWGVIPSSSVVRNTIVENLEKAIAGTPLAEPGYVFTRDTDLQGTLDSVLRNVGSMFGEGGGGGEAGLSARDLGQVSAGGTIAMREGASFMQNGAGIEVAPGAELSVSVQGGGNVQSIMDGGSVAGAVKAANLQSITVSASGLTVKSGGKPVAQISRMTIHKGGQVSIERMELLGSAATARSAEQGLSLLLGLLALAARDGDALNGAMRNAQDPAVVDGLARSQMEKEFTDAIRSMVLEYRGAVPGLDLAEVLGIR